MQYEQIRIFSIMIDRERMVMSHMHTILLHVTMYSMTGATVVLYVTSVGFHHFILRRSLKITCASLTKTNYCYKSCYRTFIRSNKIPLEERKK